MSACGSALFLIASFFLLNLVQCAEFVPCFIWSNKRTNEHVPALNKISQDVFTDEIEQYLKGGYLLVVFAEQTLSPEDFSPDTFPNLAKLRKSTKISYLPNVQNPIKALKHLDVTITEVPLDEFGKSIEIPETDILTVNLDDAKENENRIDMLKRHDTSIASIFEDLAKKNDNVLAIYTAHHTSWVTSDEVVKSRQARSLSQYNAEDNENADSRLVERSENTEEGAAEPIPSYGNSTYFHKTSSIYLYVSEATYEFEKVAHNITFDYQIDTSNGSYYVFTASGNASSHKVELLITFTNDSSPGYWEQVGEISAVVSNDTINESYNLSSTSPIYAPEGFSFHCGDQAFYNDDLKITLKDFQIQLFFNKENSTNKFGDAYDCVGFTSVPIWSGLFVTAILLIIMTIGITMMMDIRTMDRFDDAKGKTITINAE